MITTILTPQVVGLLAGVIALAEGVAVSAYLMERRGRGGRAAAYGRYAGLGQARKGRGAKRRTRAWTKDTLM